jgi:hypothetical protein
MFFKSDFRKAAAKFFLAFFLISGGLVLCQTFALADGDTTLDNLDSAESNMKKTVKGQDAKGVSGTMATLVSWVGNVICPVVACLAIVGAIASYAGGKPFMRFVIVAACLLMVSALARLIEGMVLKGKSGVN